MAFLAEVSAALSSSSSVAELVERFTQIAASQFCALCVVALSDGEGVLRPVAAAPVVASVDIEAQLEAMLGPAGPIREAMRTGQQLGDRNVIITPLSIGAAAAGAACFLDGRPAFDASDLQAASIATHQLASSLENTRVRERELLLAARSRLLARATDQLFVSLDAQAMLQALANTLVEGFGDRVVVCTAHGDELRVSVTAGFAAEGDRTERLRGTRLFLPGEERAIVSLLRDRRPLRMDLRRLRAVLRADVLSALVAGSSDSTALIAPLFVGDRFFGAIVCRARQPAEGDYELLEEVARRASLALDHAESVARERRLAKTLQQVTLPSNLASVPGALLSAIYTPAALDVRVGGDWYDAFDLDEQRILLTVGDVTGHGLHSSVVMGKLRHALNVIAMYERDPARILDVAERIVLRRYPDAIATAFAGIIDTRRRTLTYANAGHPHPVVRCHDGTLRELVADGLPIGLRSMGTAHARTVGIDDVALLALYTDGLTEATRDVFDGQQKLYAALSTQALPFVRSPAELIEDTCLPEGAQDDVAILVVNFVAADRWTFEAEDVQAAQNARRVFVQRLRERGCRPDEIETAELIFGELVANVARHAPGPADVALEWRAGGAVLHVTDRGAGYVRATRRPAPPFTENGRGLWLIQRLARNEKVEVIDGFGTHVSVELPLRFAQG